ncbi:uncharacterized protein LOC108909954 [Anoplophora glabripennis]|uniref:uncharacterized protein LOC108909954 n=1 Tax=Anoplophora glabripennis TaxID=217634 RepID=UPI000874232E|nr:uncharacterized protein LOC108909954 [Anoplophora glabripennis]
MMHDTKDTLLSPEQSMLQTRHSKWTPNILKKTFPLLNETLKQSTVATAPKLPSPPFVKLLNSEANNEIQVLVLDQSDLYDLGTGDETFNIIIDPDADHLIDKSKVKEVVVEKSQIFQLQGYACPCVEVDKDRGASTSSQSIAKQLQPALNKDKLQPVPNKDRSQPVLDKDPLKSVSSKDRLQPVRNDNPLQSVLNKGRLQPVPHEDRLQLVRNKDRLQPVLSKDNFQLVPNKDKSQPIWDKDPLELVPNRDRIQPVLDKDPLKSVSNKDRLQPVRNNSPLQSVLNKGRLQPVPNKDRLQSLRNKDRLQLVRNKDKLQPVRNKDKLQPVRNEDRLQSVLSKDKLQPVPNKDKLQPFRNEDRLQSVLSKDKLQPVPNKDKLQPVRNDDRLQSVLSKDKLQPVPNKGRLQSVRNKVKLQLVRNDERLQSVLNKDKLQPVLNKGGLQKIRNKTKLQQDLDKDRLQPVRNINVRDINEAFKSNDDVSVQSITGTLPTVGDISTTNTSIEGSLEEDGIEVVQDGETLSSSEATVEISICRTCLKPVPSCTSQKLFDVGKNQRKSYELRQKLSEVTESIDFRASLNPVVCADCLEAVHSAHAFWKRVKIVEEQIDKRRNGAVPVDLKDLLEEIAQEKLGRVRENTNKKQSSRRSAAANLEEYLEKRKRIIDKYVSSLENDSPPPETTSANTTGLNKNQTKKTLAENKSNNDQPMASILGCILSEHSQNGDCVIEIINEDEEHDSAVVDLESSVPNQESTVPNLESVQNIPVLETATPNLESSILNLESDFPILEPSPVILHASVPNTVDSDLAIDTIPSIDSNVSKCKLSEVQKNAGSVLKKRLMNPSHMTSLDTFLASRRERCQTSSRIETPQEATSSLSDEERKRKAGDAYNYLFNVNVPKKKKPPVPDTFDLFDEEHDKYFENLKGEAGCFMVRKWRRLSLPQVEFGDPPYLCEDCGKLFAKKTSFRNHLYHHKGRDVRICSYCGIQISTYRLNEHVMTRHKPPRYECNECGRKFHLKNLLALHVSLIHQNPTRRYPCHVCGVMLRKNSLATHMRRHNVSRIYPCQLCKKVFQNQVSWYYHRRRHTKTKTFSCNICSKPLKSRFSLGNHMRSYHEGGTSKTCNVCGKLLSRRESLTRHMRIVHGPKGNVLSGDAIRTEDREMSEQDEIEQATKLISNDLEQVAEVTETGEELLCEFIVEAPTGLEEVEVPYSTIDGMFLC